MIEAGNVHFAYGDAHVVDDVSLAARPGRVLGLIGPNGSGKTTLLRLLYGSLKPTAGQVSIEGESLAALGPRAIARHLSVVVQEAGGESTLTVAEMVMLGRLPRLGTFQRTGAEDHRVVAEALEQVGAWHLADRAFVALSGGERQRVLIARALAQQGDFLLLDEPTNHLDIRYQHEVLQLIREVSTSAIVVLHDLNLAARYCDDLVLMDAGRVAGRGTPDGVLDTGLLERVYRIGTTRTEIDGHVQLLFHPLARAA
ncbi:MAG: ABC transporter ATP-binding protein [Nocardioides sp.]|nr:ABC transporter ATP-binding protein [Nocardioides sp.]